MQLTIKKEIIIEVPVNKYKVNINFMFGDADGDTSEEILIDDKSTDELERLIKCLIMCNAAFPNGRGGGSEYDYDNVPDYDRYFKEDYDYDDKEQDEHEIYCEHPNDPGSDYQSTFRGFSITHFDENGIEREVEYSISRSEKEELTRRLREAGFKYSNIR